LLDIPKRIAAIECLLEQNTDSSLTYAALEGRLTLEYLCYERFKLVNPYLAVEDLKGWSPRDVVKQVSEEINENIVAGFSLAVSAETPDCEGTPTQADFEALTYTGGAHQSEIKLNKLHKLWHGLSNVALHIPVPSITTETMSIYGEREKIKAKVENLLEYLHELDGNMLFSGFIGEVFTFDCLVCEATISKPVKYLSVPRLVHCVTPTCKESYVVSVSEDAHDIVRRTFKFPCDNCSIQLEIPAQQFEKLHFQQQLGIKCNACEHVKYVVMQPAERRDDPEK
jgi:hypothetical protein